MAQSECGNTAAPKASTTTRNRRGHERTASTPSSASQSDGVGELGACPTPAWPSRVEHRRRGRGKNTRKTPRRKRTSRCVAGLVRNRQHQMKHCLLRLMHQLSPGRNEILSTTHIQTYIAIINKRYIKYQSHSYTLNYIEEHNCRVAQVVESMPRTYIKFSSTGLIPARTTA